MQAQYPKQKRDVWSCGSVEEVHGGRNLRSPLTRAMSPVARPRSDEGTSRDLPLPRLWETFYFECDVRTHDRWFIRASMRPRSKEIRGGVSERRVVCGSVQGIQHWEQPPASPAAWDHVPSPSALEGIKERSTGTYPCPECRKTSTMRPIEKHDEWFHQGLPITPEPE